MNREPRPAYSSGGLEGVSIRSLQVQLGAELHPGNFWSFQLPALAAGVRFRDIGASGLAILTIQQNLEE